MKKLVTFLVILVMSLTAAMAQSAAKLNYQAVVRSSDNHLASNETVNVTIDVKVGGATVYTETHSGVHTNINGLLNLVIGDPSTTHTGDFSTINWANAIIDATIVWGSNTVTTSNPVNAVPYALSTDCASVVNCVDDAIGDGGSTTNNAIDTIINNHLAEYQIKNCGDVTDCVNTAISTGNSTTNLAIDTVIENHLTPYEIKNCGDVTNCVKTEIGDGGSDINHGIDTIVENHLVPYTIKDCGDVTNCVKTEIEDGGSDINHRIDTLVANNIHDSLVNYTIKNCDDVVACPIIQNMRDSIQSNYEEIQHLTTDLNTLETRVETFNTHVCDSVKDCVAAQIHDSLVAHPVYNSTITFHQEGETDQSITLNQNTNQTINIVTFSQKSDRFTATASQTDFALTVPSGKTLDTDNHLVQMYINGVYVGNNIDAVVKITGNTAQYQAANNDNYTIAANDRVNFIFWVK